MHLQLVAGGRRLGSFTSPCLNLVLAARHRDKVKCSEWSSNKTGLVLFNVRAQLKPVSNSACAHSRLQH